MVINTDAPIQVLPRSRLLRPRWISDVVAPLEKSGISGYQHVRRGFDLFRLLASSCRQLVIAGLSYHAADRPEIDAMLAQVSRRARVTVIDPYPSLDLMTSLSARFKGVQVHQSGPPAW